MTKFEHYVAVLLLGLYGCAKPTRAGPSPSSAPTDVSDQDLAASSSIASGKLPLGYRDWRLMTVAHEAGELDDLRGRHGQRCSDHTGTSLCRAFERDWVQELTPRVGDSALALVSAGTTVTIQALAAWHGPRSLVSQSP